jgi:hypothetical protein
MPEVAYVLRPPVATGHNRSGQRIVGVVDYDNAQALRRMVDRQDGVKRRF